MKRQDLLDTVRRSLGGTATTMAAELALNAVLSGIRYGLLRDGEVKLAGFGSFRITHRAARRLLIPGTATEHLLPPRNTITFHPAPAQRQPHQPTAPSPDNCAFPATGSPVLKPGC